MVDAGPSRAPRWELYRVLAEPIRLRLLALAFEEELSIGELAELLDENQPNVSRHTAALRQAGLLQDRREGTRTLVRASLSASRDPVVADALASGKTLCEREGSLGRITAILRAREAPAHEFFARPGKARVDAVPSEMGAYLSALSLLLPARGLAIDAGTGDGRLLDVLAPVYEHVIAIDRAEAQLERARERIAARGFENVTLLERAIDAPELGAALLQVLQSPALRPIVGPVARKSAGVADAVFASRVLHHAPQPSRTVARLASLCAPGGFVVVVDYAPHHDETMRDQADAWLGFDADELRAFARQAGLEDARVASVRESLRGDGPDRHLPWQILAARKPAPPEGRSSANGSTSQRKGTKNG